MTENYLDLALAGVAPTVGVDAAGILKYSGLVKDVLAGLRDKGVVAGSWLEVLQITLMVIDLIQQLGPQIEAIVAKVRELIGK